MGGRGSGGKGIPNRSRQADKLTNDASLDMGMEIYNSPTIDLGDPGAIRERLSQYVAMCKRYNCRPGVGAWCQFLGCTREEIIAWSKGKHTRLDRILTPASALELQRSFGLF